MSWIPAIVACLMEICVSEENRVARLVGVYLLCKSLFDRVFGMLGPATSVASSDSSASSTVVFLALTGGRQVDFFVDGLCSFRALIASVQSLIICPGFRQ